MAAPETELHNVDDTGGQIQRNVNDREAEPNIEGATNTITNASSVENIDGTWGERDVGGPISHRVAMEDYETMRRELTRLSHSRSRSVTGPEPGSLFRTMTTRSRKSENNAVQRAESTSHESDSEIDKDLEAGDAEALAKHEEEFALGPFIKEGHFEKRTEDGGSAKKVGVVFKNLTVKGSGSTSNYARTLPDAILGTFGPDLYHIVSRFIPFLKFGRPEQTRVLLNDFTGVVRNGEMMLVLGRPGSGCTTFLKAIANQRGGYAEVVGSVTYGGITAEKQHARYRGEVNYNPGKLTS